MSFFCGLFLTADKVRQSGFFIFFDVGSHHPELLGDMLQFLIFIIRAYRDYFLYLQFHNEVIEERILIRSEAKTKEEGKKSTTALLCNVKKSLRLILPAYAVRPRCLKKKNSVAFCKTLDTRQIKQTVLQKE